jgi:hypothetical protein
VSSMGKPRRSDFGMATMSQVRTFALASREIVEAELNRKRALKSTVRVPTPNCCF